jgi:DNA-binding beta-propeller fold protein YncE
VDAVTGRVFLADASVGKLYVLDGRRGIPIRTVAINVTAGTPMLGGRGLLFVPVGAVNVVQVFDAATGRLLRAVPIAPILGPVVADPRRGRVYAVGRDPLAGQGLFFPDGSVVVLDGRTGAVRSQIAVGTDPVDIVVDDESGRVVVVSAGGLAPPRDPLGWAPDWLRHLPFMPAPPIRGPLLPARLRIFPAE